MRLAHGGPTPIRPEPPLEQPLGLLLLLGNRADGVLAESRRNGVRVDVGDETELVFAIDQVLDRAAHHVSLFVTAPACRNRTLYSQAPQPFRMCDTRSTDASSVRDRNRRSASQISGNRSATASRAQLCDTTSVESGV